MPESGNATLAADMCPRRKGGNEEDWALCRACGPAELDWLRERVAALEGARGATARKAGRLEFERDQARAEADRLRTAWEQAWAERNEARGSATRLERQLAEATASLAELAPLSTATERDDYARRIERALGVIENDTSVQAASVRLALTIPSAQREAADEITRLDEEIGG